MQSTSWRPRRASRRCKFQSESKSEGRRRCLVSKTSGRENSWFLRLLCSSFLSHMGEDNLLNSVLLLISFRNTLTGTLRSNIHPNTQVALCPIQRDVKLTIALGNSTSQHTALWLFMPRLFSPYRLRAGTPFPGITARDKPTC